MIAQIVRPNTHFFVSDAWTPCPGTLTNRNDAPYRDYRERQFGNIVAEIVKGDDTKPDTIILRSIALEMDLQ